MEASGSFAPQRLASYGNPKLTDGTFCHLQKLRHSRMAPSGSFAPPQPYQLLQSETDGWHIFCHLQKICHSRMAPPGSFAPPQPYQLWQFETDGWHLFPPSKAPPQPHGTLAALSHHSPTSYCRPKLTDGTFCHLQKLCHSRMAQSGSFAPPQPYQLLPSETDGWHLLPPSKAPPQPDGIFRQLCATTALPVMAIRN